MTAIERIYKGIEKAGFHRKEDGCFAKDDMRGFEYGEWQVVVIDEERIDVAYFHFNTCLPGCDFCFTFNGKDVLTHFVNWSKYST